MSVMRTKRGSSVFNAAENTINKVSHIRRAQIFSAVEKENEPKNGDRGQLTEVVHSNNFKKTAAAGPPVLPTTTHSTDIMGPDVYSPLFQLANLNLPRDRVTQNAWNRVFYDTHPIVRNSINLHASYPISKINIVCKDKKIQNFFLEMAEKINLYDVVYGVALEFWKLGEAFPYAELEPSTGMWKRISILNPDYIYVEGAVIGDQTIISLRPDAALQRLINSNNPRDLQIKRRLPDYIVDYVKKGQNIPLDNFNISHLKLLSSPYDIRGTSIIVSCYKDLMLYDKLRESKFAQADGMVNPMTLVKLGGNDYRPTASDIQAMKSALEDAQYDKDFKLVTHDGVTIERVGYNGGVMDVSGDIEIIKTNLYTGLMTPKALIEQESASYASSSIGLEVLRQRYDIFRNMIKKWLERKIFAPIAEINGFKEYVDGEERLVIPQIDFNHMNLWDMGDYISSISTYVGNKQISVQTLYRSLGLSYEEEERRLKEEMISNVIRSKEEAALTTMRLSELRALDSDSQIVEPPIEQMEQMGMQQGMSAGGDDMGMGGLPGLDMGGPPMGGGLESAAPELGGGSDLGGLPS
jgi:hypothetical protein